MARIRTIKPDFWTDERIVELDPIDRLLFIGLWNFADDQGYLDYSPKRIKMQVFPGDDIDVSRGLARIHALGRIRLYDSPEGQVLQIVNWSKHQRVSNPAKPRYMASDLQECPWPGGSVQSPPEDSRVLGKGREGKGVTTSSDKSDGSDPFDEFWQRYPRKDAKQDARKAWVQVTKTTPPEKVIEGVTAYAFSPDRQFQPLPASWLRGRRWEDETSNVHHLPRTAGGTTPRTHRPDGQLMPWEK